MALKHALLSSKTPTSQNLAKSSSTADSLPPSFLRFPSAPFGQISKHSFRVNLRPVKCSLEYGQDAFAPTTYPRPKEIQWRKELANSVQLIGVVATPVEIRHLASSPTPKAVAWTRLAVKKSPTDTSWINLTFWDELAQTAFQHVEKGQQIYVSGRLVSDVVESEEGKQQTYYKVVVQQLNFIERSFSSGTFNDNAFSYSITDRNYGNNNSKNAGSTEELWQAFFANPLDWWDNRENKRNPKYPDFKHKDTGEALWVEGKYNPSWVKSQLAILDSRMSSLPEQGPRMPVSTMAGDDALHF